MRVRVDCRCDGLAEHRCRVNRIPCCQARRNRSHTQHGARICEARRAGQCSVSRLRKDRANCPSFTLIPRRADG